jgi:hypothetical protein
MLLSRLAYLPNFSNANQLIVFSKNASVIQPLEGVKPSLLVIDDEPPWVGAQQVYSPIPILYSFEAETGFTPISGHWAISPDVNASNGMSLSSKQGSVHRDLFARTTEYYSMSIRYTSSSNMSFSIDGQTVRSISIVPAGKYAWSFSTPLLLHAGYHDLRISIDDQRTGLIDIVNILSSSTSDPMYARIVGPPSDQPTVSTEQISPTRLIVDITSTMPTYIAIGESYDDLWTASLKTTQLPHFVEAGWASAYYLRVSGESTVLVTYAGQESRIFLIYLWISSWAAVLVSLVILRLKRKQSL